MCGLICRYFCCFRVCVHLCACIPTVRVCGFIVGMCVGGGGGVSLCSVPACSGNGCFFH